MTDYLHSGANKMNKVEAYKNDNKLLLADKLGHAKVSSIKEQNLLNTIATVQQHSNNKITQLEADANKVRGAYVYKGTVETEFDLPLNNNSVGDVYNTSSTGMNYAWNGENWDELGSNLSSSSSTLNNSEPYQQVFALDVTGSATSQQMIITDEDLGGQYKDILISCFTPQAPTRTIAGDAPDYVMHLFFLKTRTFSTSSSDTLLDFSYYSMDQNDYLSPFIFVYHFINDGGLIKGKQGKTKLNNYGNAQGIPILNDTLTEIFPFPLTVDENIAPKGIFITPSLPIGSRLVIYARNKLNLNEQEQPVLN